MILRVSRIYSISLFRVGLLPDRAGGGPPLNDLVSVFLGGLRRELNQLLVTTTLALPEGIDRARIGGVLIDRAIRRNNLSATDGTRATAGCPLLNIDVR